MGSSLIVALCWRAQRWRTLCSRSCVAWTMRLRWCARSLAGLGVWTRIVGGMRCSTWRFSAGCAHSSPSSSERLRGIVDPTVSMRARLSTPRVVVCFDYKIFAPNAGGHLGSVFRRAQTGHSWTYPRLVHGTGCLEHGRRGGQGVQKSGPKARSLREKSRSVPRAWVSSPVPAGPCPGAVAGFSVGLGVCPSGEGSRHIEGGSFGLAGIGRARERGSLRFHLLSG
jgi:hypothetical protein